MGITGNIKRAELTDRGTPGVYGVQNEKKRGPSMREETQLEDICVYCGKPITTDQYPCRGLEDGRRAHLICSIDHDDAEKLAANRRKNGLD